MILNGDEIIAYHERGLIGVDPWDVKRVGTNSYDVCLYPKLKRYICSVIDPRRENPIEEIEIPPEGFLLKRGEFVLGGILEYCDNRADDLVPMIEGRSSVARLGLFVHLVAGRGDVQYSGRWTLEIMAAQDIFLYPKMPIAQLFWIKTSPTSRAYHGKYQACYEIAPSKLFKDFNEQDGQLP